MLYLIRTNRYLNTFVILTRLLIGFAFIPSGLKKVLGERFTNLSVETQIGFFFEGLYQSGIYWNFLGLGQMVAAFLLMTQRLATIGAVMFFFIITNIWMITVSMKFTGTWIITSLLLLATIMLLIWDSHKLKYLFLKDNFSTQPVTTTLPTYNNLWVITGYVTFIIGLAGSVVLMKMSNPVPGIVLILSLPAIVLGVLIADEINFRKKQKSIIIKKQKVR